jgi:hypothetical protein
VEFFEKNAYLASVDFDPEFYEYAEYFTGKESRF